MELWKWKLSIYVKIYVATCLFVMFEVNATLNGEDYVSAIGDPGMKRDELRVAIESSNQCNEVGEETPNMGSPRMADCFDVNYSERNNQSK
jgi:hypothetical protein